MHKEEDFHSCLMKVLTAQEAAVIWGLSRNTISDACRRGALRGRKSEKTWLVTIQDMLIYQKGRYWPDLIPDELLPAFKQAIVFMDENS